VNGSGKQGMLTLMGSRAIIAQKQETEKAGRGIRQADRPDGMARFFGRDRE